MNTIDLRLVLARVGVAIYLLSILGCTMSDANRIVVVSPPTAVGETLLVHAPITSSSDAQGWSRVDRSAKIKHHLYIGAGDDGHAYVFPLDDGIPASSPSRIITYASGEATAEGLGPDGTVYISLNEFLIDSYAPNNNGPTPSDSFSTGIAVGALALDSENRLYAGGINFANSDYEIAIYSPPPRHVIQTLTDLPAFPGQIAVGKAGDLYFTNTLHTTYVYVDPVNSPHIRNAFCIKSTAIFLALDDDHEIMFGSVFGSRRAIAVFDRRTKSCPARPLRYIEPAGIKIHLVDVVGTFDGHLYAEMFPDTGPRNQGVLFTFDLHRDRQKPLSALTYGPNGFAGFIGVAP